VAGQFADDVHGHGSREVGAVTLAKIVQAAQGHSDESGPGTLYALDLKSGQKRSELKIPEMIATPIFVAEGVLYFGTFEGSHGYIGSMFAVH
jgi:outer membrane protein assembly factor BamB